MFENFQNILVWIVSTGYIHIILYLIFLTAILTSEKSSESIMAWIFTITIFPFLGFILYLFFGMNWRKKRAVSYEKEKDGKGNFLKYDTAHFFRSEKMKPDENEKIYRYSGISRKDEKISEMLYKSEGGI